MMDVLKNIGVGLAVLSAGAGCILLCGYLGTLVGIPPEAWLLSIPLFALGIIFYLTGAIVRGAWK